MRALEGCRLRMDLAIAAGSHDGRRGSAWPPAMKFVKAQSQLGGGEVRARRLKVGDEGA